MTRRVPQAARHSVLRRCRILRRTLSMYLKRCPGTLAEMSMHADHEVFVSAIHSRSKLRLTFFSKEDRAERIRICAPFDFGPLRRAKDQSDRYHFWNYDGDKKAHSLSISGEQVISMTTLEESFDPAEIVTWSPTAWRIPRDWGAHS